MVRNIEIFHSDIFRYNIWIFILKKGKKIKKKTNQVYFILVGGKKKEKKSYQPKTIHLENHSNKTISGRLQTLKEKHKKQHMNIVNLTIEFTCRAWSSKIKDVSEKFQNCEIV